MPRQCRGHGALGEYITAEMGMVVANTGAHQRDPVAMAHAVQACGEARERYRTRRSSSAAFTVPSVLSETYLAGPSTPEKIEAVEEAVASRTWIPRTEAVPDHVAVHDTRRLAPVPRLRGDGRGGTSRKLRPAPFCTTSGRS